MKLTYYHGATPNFGDELNATIWDRLLPAGFLDGRDEELFLGIGSILWDDHPKAAMKHVIGSGYGGYTAVPDVHDGTWNVVWVRGPLTAKRLGIDPARAITDSAVLLRATDLPPPEDRTGIAFMPHFESVGRGNWAKACELAGVTFLDPRDDPQRLIARIRGADMLITEAMHGAIVADTLRTPFIPILPSHPSHRAKWFDWALSMELDLVHERMRPSSMLELYVQKTGLCGQGKTSRRLLKGLHMRPVNMILAERAAAWLRKLAASCPPMLSTDATVERVTDRSLHALDAFVRTARMSRAV